jgi:hypothetical protein
MNTDMKKQTALQWLYAKLDQMSTRDEVCDLVYQLEEESKAIEKEQIIEAHGLKRVHHVQQGVDYWVSTCGLEYYDQTYGGDK